MTISAIKDGIVSGLGTAFTAVKDAVIWCGHKISYGFTNYVVPFVKAVWAGTLVVLAKVFAFLRTGFGLGTLGITAGAALLAIENNLSKETHWAANVALKVAAASLFVLAGAAITLGSVTVI